MAKFIADQNQTGFFYESGTYANTSGNLQWIGEVQSVTATANTGVIPIRYQGTATRNIDKFVDGPIDYTGTITYYPQDWKFLGFALGSMVDAGSPSPYTHELNEVNSDDGNAFTSGITNPMMSFGLEIAEQHNPTGLNFIRTLKGCMVNTWTMNVSEGEILSCDMTYIAQTEAFSSGAVTSLTETTTRPFVYSDFRLHLPSGTVLDHIKSCTFNVANNMRGPHYCNGSREISTPIPLSRDYSVDLTIDADSAWYKTLYNQYYKGGSEFNLMMEVNASTGSRDAFFIFSGCEITSMESPTGVDGSNEQTLTITPKNCIVNVNDAIELYNPW